MFIQSPDGLFLGLKAVEEITKEKAYSEKFFILFKTYLNLKTELNNKWEGYTHSNYDKGLIFLLFKELIKMESRGEKRDYLKQSWLVLIPKMFPSPLLLPIDLRCTCKLYLTLAQTQHH